MNSAVQGGPFHVTFQVTEIIDFADPFNPASWYNVDANNKAAMEAAAQANPAAYFWRTDAINLYLVGTMNAGGVCSFPHSPVNDDDIILVQPNIANGSIGMLHEIGHYFNLRHTHANYEGSAGNCPGGTSGDCVADTPDDTNPSFCSPFSQSCHGGNLLNLNYSAQQYAVLRYNLMSYHGPTTPSDVIITAGQGARMMSALNNQRTNVVQTGGGGGGGNTVALTEDFETNVPGWTHFGVTGLDEWQAGTPTGITAYDPASAYQGSRIVGTDLGFSGGNGFYGNNSHQVLRSPIVNCSGLSGVQLSFARFLTVEQGIYDQARIYVNGQLVWENPANTDLLDQSWSLQTLDIGALANNNPSVQIEWHLVTDASVTFGGWNIDQVRITGAGAAASAPTVTNVSPASGSVAGGTQVTITGSGFTNSGTSVTLGGTPATSVNVTSATTLTCVTPAHAVGQVTVAVQNANGTGQLQNGFTYAGVSLTSVNPATGSAGTQVTLQGQGFSGGWTGVWFNGAIAGNIQVVSNTTITCIVPNNPNGAGSNANVVVGKPAGSAQLASAFSYQTTPVTLTSVSPSTGPVFGGTQVTLQGTGFSGGYTGVWFNGAAASNIQVISNTTITCVTPPNPNGASSSAIVVVGKPHGSASRPAGFNYAQSAPTLSQVSPAFGPGSGGTPVTLTGSGFLGSWTGVWFNGRLATNITVVSNTQISCVTPPIVPSSPQSATVVVGKPSGSATAPGAFFYTSAAAPITTENTGGSVAPAEARVCFNELNLSYPVCLELANLGTAPADLRGLSIEVHASTGRRIHYVISRSDTLEPGSFSLVGEPAASLNVSKKLTFHDAPFFGELSQLQAARFVLTTSAGVILDELEIGAGSLVTTLPEATRARNWQRINIDATLGAHEFLALDVPTLGRDNLGQAGPDLAASIEDDGVVRVDIAGGLPKTPFLLATDLETVGQPTGTVRLAMGTHFLVLGDGTGLVTSAPECRLADTGARTLRFSLGAGAWQDLTWHLQWFAPSVQSSVTAWVVSELTTLTPAQ